MRLNTETFIGELKDIYLKNPCRVSSVAFWKTERICREGDTYRIMDDGKTYLYAIRDRRMEFYWSDNTRRFILSPEEVNSLDFLVLHDDFYRLIADDVTGYEVMDTNPQIYDFTHRQRNYHSEDFFIADFDFNKG